MPDVSDRLQKLTQLLVREPDDPFLLYALAMEHKKLGSFEESLACLSRVLAKDAGYHVAHRLAAQIHELTGDRDAARVAYRAGIEAARQKGDSHAVQEMQAALAEIE